MTISHVLARKYRPQTFNDLIGQEALVQTVSNAIKQNRLPNAYMLTGIRGVGKTTSARIIAKGLNCIGKDGHGNMTPNPCGECQHCREITADSHIDVIEIDAASNTGVDNVREIIEGAKYNPVSARFKIYIIDEVHMLSNTAFNALLKTLEEPPERVKFIFATTEIRKVPVTILSRCQRFDLKRVDEEVLTQHLKRIAEAESATVETEALHLIARAGDGSVRDSLSLLDQALTQFDMVVKADNVRQMMGLSNKTALLDLYESLMRGDIEKALNLTEAQCKIGADSLALLQDMLDLTHWLTRIKITPALADDVTISENTRQRGKEMAQNLSMGSLSAVWQVLLKGIDEVRRADNPWQTLEMLIIRIAYLADLPTPAKLVDEIKKNTLMSRPQAEASDGTVYQPQKLTPSETAHYESLKTTQPVVSVAPVAHEETASNKKSQFQTFADMVSFVKESGERLLAFNLENYVRAESLNEFVLVCSISPDAPLRLGGDLLSVLKTKAHENWRIEQKKEVQAATLKEKKEAHQSQLIEELSQEPIIKKTLELFNKAKINRVHQINIAETE